MKTTLNKLLFTLMLFLVNIAIFAQPNPDPDGSDPNPTDSPIDGNLLWLLAFGLLFVAFKYYRNRQLVK